MNVLSAGFKMRGSNTCGPRSEHDVQIGDTRVHVLSSSIAMTCPHPTEAHGSSLPAHPTLRSNGLGCNWPQSGGTGLHLLTYLHRSTIRLGCLLRKNVCASVQAEGTGCLEDQLEYMPKTQVPVNVFRHGETWSTGLDLQPSTVRSIGLDSKSSTVRSVGPSSRSLTAFCSQTWYAEFACTLM